MIKPQWNFNQNTQLFIHETAYENVVCEMAAIFPGEDKLTSSCLSRRRLGTGGISFSGRLAPICFSDIIFLANGSNCLKFGMMIDLEHFQIW